MGERESKALIDTGAYHSAMPLHEFRMFKEKNDISEIKLPDRQFARVANGASVEITTMGELIFCFAGQEFVESFLVIEGLNNMILGLPFFEKNKIIIYPHGKRLQMSDMTIQLNEILKGDGTVAKTYKKNMYHLGTMGKVVI